MGEEYPLILVCTGELPAGGFSAEGCPFHSRDHSRMLPAHTSPPLQPGECSDGSDQPGKEINFCRGTGIITPNITALSPSVGVV